MSTVGSCIFFLFFSLFHKKQKDNNFLSILMWYLLIWKIIGSNELIIEQMISKSALWFNSQSLIGRIVKIKDQ